MLNREEALRQIEEMPIDELQDLICKALDDSGIKYRTDGTGVSLAEFFMPQTVVEERQMRYGTWSERYDEDDDIFLRRKFVCSACGGWNTYGETNFCPECGANMRGTEPGLEAIMDVVLEDDGTAFGGVMFSGETVRDFISSVWEGFNAIKTVDELNKALIAYGIKPINQSNIS